MKILILAHGHPDFSVGGAEVAAYNLYQSLKGKEQITEVNFLARTDMSSINHGTLTMRRQGEYLWRQDIGDWFKLRIANGDALLADFRSFLTSKAPDVVYVHHYVHIGIEVLKEIRRTLPKCKLILTLHEYVAICHRQGQMIKNRTNKLCYRETPQDCSVCFPEFSPEDFWLRRHYIQRHFEAVDMFVSPSKFLLDRYVEWGIPREAICVIENGQPSFTPAPREPALTARSTRLAYFGQITEYKGVDVLLQAICLLQPAVRARISVEIHAPRFEPAGSPFLEQLEKLRTALITEGSLRWVGAYERNELQRRMSKVDWIVVPSIWWENSPMVIQEAFASGRPVICSNIGGMEEKVRHGVDGLHFEARNPLDLAETITRIVTEPHLADELARRIKRPLSYNECAEAYLDLVSDTVEADSPSAPVFA